MRVVCWVVLVDFPTVFHATAPRRLVQHFKVSWPSGRGSKIRTCDLRYPKPSRYQAAPCPDASDLPRKGHGCKPGDALWRFVCNTAQRARIIAQAFSGDADGQHNPARACDAADGVDCITDIRIIDRLTMPGNDTAGTRKGPAQSIGMISRDRVRRDLL